MPPDPTAVRAAVDAAIGKLRVLCQSVNPLDLLSRVAFHHLMKPDGKDAGHMMRDAGIMAVISMNAIQAIISVGANVPTFADLEQKFRTVDGEDRAGMSNPA